MVNFEKNIIFKVPEGVQHFRGGPTFSGGGGGGGGVQLLIPYRNYYYYCIMSVIVPV